MNWQIIEPIVWITLAFILADIIFGTAKAIYLQTMSSKVLRKGMWHKLAFIGAIILAYLLQVAIMHTDLGFEVPTVAAVCIYLIYTECVSIFENLCEINPKLLDSPLGRIFANTTEIKRAEEIEEPDAHNR